MKALLDGANHPSILEKEFTIRTPATAIGGANLSADVLVELKVGTTWQLVGTVTTAEPTLGIYTAGQFRVSSASLGGTTLVEQSVY